MGSQSHPAELGQQREASLASERAILGRSVDSECQGRVIEPRKTSFRGEPSLFFKRGPRRRTVWPGASVPPGSESRAQAHQDSPGTWEVQPSLVDKPWRGAATPQSPRLRGRRRAAGSEHRRTASHRLAKDNEASGTGGWKSHSAIVPWRLGNSPRRTQWREGHCQRAEPAGGNRQSTLRLASCHRNLAG